MSKKTVFLLWGLCIIGGLAILPYIYFLGVIPANISKSQFIVTTLIQAVFLYGVFCWLSYLMLQKTPLQPFKHKPFLKEMAYPGIIAGAVVGIALLVLDKFFFNAALQITPPPRIAGLLAAVYGGINEEVFSRLFLLTLVFFILNYVLKNKHRKATIWSAIIISALVFGFGHYVLASKIAPLDAAQIARLYFFNGAAGIVYGWLYCEKGFWSAAIAHFTTDIIFHTLYF